ncbi:hypothetical protein L1987_76413 [Smallanthus sonchifolius]|uniref:Uncharacterized protein n=1 Tax=Smallanthus sonchifolius TaxID=185202 RepID=A0ACB9A973_9ASTR|nr:hypothetical protein L1987_76413 [Smallanthus sonchifolius]
MVSVKSSSDGARISEINFHTLSKHTQPQVRVDHISIAFINRDEITRLKAQHLNMSHQQVFGISDKNVIYRNRHALIGRAIDDQDIDRIVNLLNITDEPTNSTDLARVLETTHSNTKAKGSSTAFIIALTHQGLSAINLVQGQLVRVAIVVWMDWNEGMKEGRPAQRFVSHPSLSQHFRNALGKKHVH